MTRGCRPRSSQNRRLKRPGRHLCIAEVRINRSRPTIAPRLRGPAEHHAFVGVGDHLDPAQSLSRSTPTCYADLRGFPSAETVKLRKATQVEITRTMIPLTANPVHSKKYCIEPSHSHLGGRKTQRYKQGAVKYE